MKKESKEKLFKYIFICVFMILFISFITVYLANESGYYEYNNHQKVVLTNEKIKQFEEDVANGLNVKLESYYEVEDKDYNNNLSLVGLNISKRIGNFTKSSIKLMFQKLNKLLQ